MRRARLRSWIRVVKRAVQGKQAWAAEPSCASVIARVGLIAALCLVASPDDARAQSRASENAVTQAQDAFGINVGSQSTGLYNNNSVRGFSPTTAGNVRIDGLYFDQAAELPHNLWSATTIRVGLSAFGFAFPAPTGVVDYQIRRPGDAPSRSAYVYADTQLGAKAETDAVIPLRRGRLSIGVGAGLYRNEYDNGTDSSQLSAGVRLRWQPIDGFDVLPFFSLSNMYDNKAGPNVVPAGSTLPPKMERRRFRGPNWAAKDSAERTFGVIAVWTPDASWTGRLGLFRSVNRDGIGYTNLITGVTPDGLGRQIISVDPPSGVASTSGEIRLSRRLGRGDWFHQLHLSVRGRDRRRLSGGSAQYDLGLISLSSPQMALEPNYIFSQQTREAVRQWIGGAAYDGRWRGLAQLNAAVQYTDYRKRTIDPTRPAVTSHAGLLLWNGSLAANLSDDVVLYGGATRGLEESGVAPAAAVNRNAALPAILTSQVEVGARWRLQPGLTLILGAFEVSKPYFNLDDRSVWRELGKVRNRGVEVSLSGEVLPGLSVVAGAVALDAVVTGEAVGRGDVGRRPVGSSPLTVLVNADWRPPGRERVSFDLGASYSADIVASRDNRAIIPPRTTIDVGVRYRLHVRGSNATLRAQIKNITNEGGFSLRGSGAFGVTSSRVASVSLTSDF